MPYSEEVLSAEVISKQCTAVRKREHPDRPAQAKRAGPNGSTTSLNSSLLILYLHNHTHYTRYTHYNHALILVQTTHSLELTHSLAHGRLTSGKPDRQPTTCGNGQHGEALTRLLCLPDETHKGEWTHHTVPTPFQPPGACLPCTCTHFSPLTPHLRHKPPFVDGESEAACMLLTT